MKGFGIIITMFIFSINIVLCDIGDYDEAVRKGNGFVDKLLRIIVIEKGSDNDPYHLPDKVKTFSKTVLGVTVSGEASFHTGFIRGITSLNRADGCHLKEEGDKLIVKADLGAGVLDMQYSGSVKFMSYGPTITAHGKIDYVEVTLIMSCNAEDGRNGTLVKFSIDDMKGVHVWIVGLGSVLNWATTKIANIAESLFKGFIHHLIEKQIDSHLAEKIETYQFPVENTITSTQDDYMSTEKPEISLNRRIFNNS